MDYVLNFKRMGTGNDSDSVVNLHPQFVIHSIGPIGNAARGNISGGMVHSPQATADHLATAVANQVKQNG